MQERERVCVRESDRVRDGERAGGARRSARPPSDQRGRNLKISQDFHLKAKARILP